MQALWSRTAAQTRPCQCGPCLHAPARVSRRTSTAVGARKIRASDVFTASFTAMFATAAVIDAKKKDERTQQWDQAIRDVRAGKDLASIITPDQVSIGKAALGTSNIMGRETGKYAPDETVLRKIGSSTATVKKLLSTIPITMSEAYEQSAPTIQPMSAIWHELQAFLSESLKISSDTHLGFSETHDGRMESTEEDNSLFCEQEQQGYSGTPYWTSKMPHREPTNELHLSKMQDMVIALVCELLQTTASMEERIVRSKDGACSVSKFQKANQKSRLMAERLQALANGYTPFPRYQPVDRAENLEERKNLNRTIAFVMRDGLNKNGNRSLNLMVAKICYNLLVSPAAPSITTYNIMIERFTRYKYHELAKVVINSYLTRSRYSPNERTLSALLDHFAATNNEESFYKTIALMRGKIVKLDGARKGLGLKDRPADDLTIAAVQDWALTHKVHFRQNGFVGEKANWNGQVFESIIRGALKLTGLKSALRYFKQALVEGCIIRTELFHVLVDRCMRKKKYLVLLLSALCHQWSNGQGLMSALKYDCHVRERMYDVLKACGLDPTMSALHKAPLPLDICPESLDRMIYHMHYEEARDSSIHLFQKASLIEKKIVQAKVRADGRVKYLNLVQDVPSFMKLSTPPGQLTDHAFSSDLSSTPNIKKWLKTFHLPKRLLAKYTSCLQSMAWGDLVGLDSKGLEDLGIDSSGTRTRILERFARIKDIKRRDPGRVESESCREDSRQLLDSFDVTLQQLKDSLVQSMYQQMPKNHQVEYDKATANSTIRDQINLLLDSYRELATQGLLVDPIESSQSLATQSSMEFPLLNPETEKVGVSNDDPATDDVWADIPFPYNPRDTAPLSGASAAMSRTSVIPTSTSWYPPSYGRQVGDKPALANSWS